MEDETSSVDDNSVIVSLEKNKGKKEPKRGISVTRALVMMGFDDWKDLEPSKFFYLVLYYIL